MPIVDSRGLSDELVSTCVWMIKAGSPVLSVTALDIALPIVILAVYQYYERCM